VAAHLERAELRDAFRTIFELADLANKRFQDGEPWKTRVDNPPAAAALIRDLCYVLRDLAVMIHPYLPFAAERLASFLGKKIGAGGLDWSGLGKQEGLDRVQAPTVLFAKLEDEFVAALRERYSGSQAERALRDAEASSVSALVRAPQAAGHPAPAQPDSDKAAPRPRAYPDLSDEARFARLIDLRAAKIVKIERHPKADKLYIETLDDGSGAERIIVSGLVPFYREEELLGKTIVLVNNLKPAKLRGVESRGMLLAASRPAAGESGGKEAVEVLDAGAAAPGSRILLEGQESSLQPDAEIDVETFFSVPLRAEGGAVLVGQARLLAAGLPFTLGRVTDGEVG